MPRVLDEAALVLEVGSGAGPWSRSDVLVDRFYIDDSGQRGGATIHRDHRPLLIAAGERLPFVDKAFDFVYCRHVIEHAEDIAAFLGEMSRVGKSGYLECPNPALERVLDQPQHLWYIANNSGRLLIHPKTKMTQIATCHDRLYFHMMSDHLLIRNYWDLFVVKLDWHDRIDFELCSNLAQVLAVEPPEQAVAARVTSERVGVLRRAWLGAVREDVRGSLVRRLKSMPVGPMAVWLRRTLRARRAKLLRGRGSRPENLDVLLCCPHCRGPLTHNALEYVCRDCAGAYPIKGGVPVFLLAGG